MLLYDSDLTPEENAICQAMADKYDAQAPARSRKDATLNMRIAASDLERIKARANKDGYTKYQSWVRDVIDKELNK